NGARRHRAREIRSREQGVRRFPGGPYDGLPQPERDHRRRDRVVARAEARAAAGGDKDGELAMRRFITFLCAAVTAAAFGMSAQSAVPDIVFDSNPSLLTMPDDVYLGEVGGVAANSKGDIYVYSRTGHPTISIGTSRAFAHGGSRLLQLDRSGKFVRELG